MEKKHDIASDIKSFTNANFTNPSTDKNPTIYIILRSFKKETSRKIPLSSLIFFNDVVGNALAIGMTGDEADGASARGAIDVRVRT